MDESPRSGFARVDVGGRRLASILAGLRDYTAFLSGTAANPEMHWRMVVFLGLSYIVFYLGVVLLVPILLLAAGLLAGWDWLVDRRYSGERGR